MYEEEQGNWCMGNERGSRHGDEILMGFRPLPAAVDRDAANAAKYVSRDGSRGW